MIKPVDDKKEKVRAFDGWTPLKEISEGGKPWPTIKNLVWRTNKKKTKLSYKKIGNYNRSHLTIIYQSFPGMFLTGSENCCHCRDFNRRPTTLQHNYNILINALNQAWLDWINCVFFFSDHKWKKTKCICERYTWKKNVRFVLRDA